MATLTTEKITFKPNMKLIREQCDAAVQRNPLCATDLASAITGFETACTLFDQSALKEGTEMLFKIMKCIGDENVPELEAACLFYLGCTALALGESDQGISWLDAALRNTRDPWLALCTYNIQMTHFLSSNSYQSVVALASATKKVMSQLPASEASLYYGSAASYNLAEAHFRKCDYAMVLQPVKEAIDGFHALSMRQEEAKSQGLLGNALVSSGDAKGGLPYIDKSLQFFQHANIEPEFGFLLQGRGTALLKLGRKSEAIRDFREAVQFFKRQGDAKAASTLLAAVLSLEESDG
jgi:tetratricopeptide (TPR) repeat protein